MNTLQDSLKRYVAMRRALGAKLQEPAGTLGQFVDFMKGHAAEFITTELALRWAMQPKNVQRATWARRLSIGEAICRLVERSRSTNSGSAASVD